MRPSLIHMKVGVNSPSIICIVSFPQLVIHLNGLIVSINTSGYCYFLFSVEHDVSACSIDHISYMDCKHEMLCSADHGGRSL